MSVWIRSIMQRNQLLRPGLLSFMYGPQMNNSEAERFQGGDAL